MTVEDIAARLRDWSEDITASDDDPETSDLPSAIFALSLNEQMELARTVDSPLTDYLSRIVERGSAAHARKALELLQELSESTSPAWGEATAYSFFYEPTTNSATRIAEVIAGGEGVAGYLSCLSAVKQMAAKPGERRALALSVLRLAQTLGGFERGDFIDVDLDDI